MMVERLALLLACYLPAMATGADLVQVQTFQFAENDERPLRYFGGLLGNSARSGLAGSFDVSVFDDATLEITRFDVEISDALLTGVNPPAGLVDGDGLAERLMVAPVGLVGLLSNGEARFDSRLETGLENDNILFDIAFDQMPKTSIRISGFDEDQVSVFIQSNYGSSVLDAPAFATTDLGLLAQRVPEPSALLIAATTLFLGQALRRSHH